jgi:ribose transport system substrate-binding protein
MDQALRSLHQEKMPLVLFNPTNEQFYGGVGFSQDEFEVGKATGLYAGELIRDEMGGTARVVILDYPSIPNLVTRANGIEAGIAEVAPNAVIVAHAQGGTVEDGKTNIASLIADGVAFDVIASINDAGSFGAIEAMDEAGFPPGSVAAISIDGEARAQNYIREGHFLRGSLPVARELFSRSAVNAMIKLLAGVPIPESVVLRPGEMITRDAP